MDLHICGSCKSEFSMIDDFLVHKKACGMKVMECSPKRAAPSEHATMSHLSLTSKKLQPVEYKYMQSVLSLEHGLGTAVPNQGSDPSPLTYVQPLKTQAEAPEMDSSSYMDHSQEVINTSAALLHAQSAHNQQLLDNIAQQMRQLQQNQETTNNIQTVAPNQTSADIPAPNVVHVEQPNTSSTSQQTFTTAQLQLINSEIGEAPKGSTMQVTYQISHHGAVPVLQLTNNQCLVQNSNSKEVQLVTIPPHAQGSSDNTQSVAMGTKSPTVESPRPCKRGKYSRLTSKLIEANASLSLVPEPKFVDGANLPEGMVERYVQKEKSPAQYTCPHEGCSYMTQYSKNIDRHVVIHTGAKPYACTVCDARFGRADKLKEHMRCHTGEKPYKCNTCSYRCSDGGSLKKHNRIHTNERPYKCQFCSYASRNSSQLTLHLRTHTGDKPFMCPECTATFKIKSDLTRHKRLHTGERPYSCPLCHVKTAVKSNLTAHMKIYHSEDKMMECAHCDMRTSSKRALRLHCKEHFPGPQMCTVEDCSHSDRSCVNFQISEVPGPAEALRCSRCTYVTMNKARLTRHINSLHSGEYSHGRNRKVKVAAPTLHKGTAALSKEETYACVQCGAEFVRKDSLRSHIRSHEEVDKYTADKKGKLRDTAVTPAIIAESFEEVETSSELCPAPGLRVQQEHEYAAVSLQETVTSQTMVQNPGQVDDPRAHSQINDSTQQAEQALIAKLTDYHKLQNTLPYIENNHNTAVWDNMQNMAISDHQEDQGHLDHRHLGQGQTTHGHLTSRHSHQSEASQGHLTNRHLGQGHLTNRHSGQGQLGNRHLGHGETGQSHQDSKESGQGYASQGHLNSRRSDRGRSVLKHVNNEQCVQSHVDCEPFDQERVSRESQSQQVTSIDDENHQSGDCPVSTEVIIANTSETAASTDDWIAMEIIDCEEMDTKEAVHPTEMHGGQGHSLKVTGYGFDPSGVDSTSSAHISQDCTASNVEPQSDAARKRRSNPSHMNMQDYESACVTPITESILEAGAVNAAVRSPAVEQSSVSAAQTPPVGIPFHQLTPLSSLPMELQQILTTLNLPRGQVVTVPLGDQAVQILIDITSTRPQTGVVQAKATPLYDVDNQVVALDSQNNNPGVSKIDIQLVPDSASNSGAPIISIDGHSRSQSDLPVTVRGTVPSLHGAQPLFLMSAVTSPALDRESSS